MEINIDDVNVDQMSPDELNEMEERRLVMLEEHGIDEYAVIEKIRGYIQAWNEYFSENITRGRVDMQFAVREQWTQQERNEFARLSKPAMTFNKIYDPVKKLIGEQRENKPDLMVRSLTGKADQKEIDLRSDLIRTISYQSQNDLVYQCALKSSLLMGFGAYQINLDYESPLSFRKTIRYQMVPDVTVCSWDTAAVKPHKGDGNFCSRLYFMSKEEFAATFPYIQNPISFGYYNSYYNYQWIAKDLICIAEAFVKEWYPLVIYELSNGDSVTQEQWEERQKAFKESKDLLEGSEVEKILDKEMQTIVGERHTQDYRIMHYRILQDQIIDFSEWPSKNLPLVFVDGDSHYLEGRQYTKSFVHDAIDAQKMLNYSRSETIAEIKNRRREQWMATPDNIVGQEQQWRNPELQMGALIAKPDPKTSMMPQKMPAWDISQGLFATSASSSQDIREILGFSENEKLQGRDISGKARRERKMEGSMSAAVYFSNLNQAVEQGGRIVNDLLPYIFNEDKEHNYVVTRKNGQSDSIIINQRENDNVVNRIGAGDFDVEIDTGPSFAVQKEIALEFLQATIQASPQTFPLIADLWAKNLDVQFMPQMAERFKTIVPPEIIAKEEGQPPPPPKPDPQAMMMQQEMQNKQQEIMERAQELKIRQEKMELEKAELMLKARQMQERTNSESQRDQYDLAKSKLDFQAKMAKIMADMHRM